MNTLSKAYDTSRALVTTTRITAGKLKAAGSLDLSPGASGGGFFGDVSRQAGDRRRMGLFRGWVYAAINQLSLEASGQPVNVGRLGDAEMEDERKSKRRNDNEDFVRLEIVLDHHSPIFEGKWDVPLYLDKEWPITGADFLECVDSQ